MISNDKRELILDLKAQGISSKTLTQKRDEKMLSNRFIADGLGIEIWEVYKVFTGVSCNKERYQNISKFIDSQESPEVIKERLSIFKNIKPIDRNITDMTQNGFSYQEAIKILV